MRLDRWAAGLADFVRSRYGLARPLENDLNELWERPGQQRFLHVGCGNARKSQTVKGFMSDEWHEIRLDSNPDVAPDVVASMTSMPMIPDGAVKAVFSSHNIEHLLWHQIQEALAEFHRVTDDTGFLVITCPDLQSIARLVMDDKLLDVAYVSPAGPVTPFDMMYGMRSMLAGPEYFMAHRSGFTLKTLLASVQQAGFSSCLGVRREGVFDLWAFASKRQLNEEEIRALAEDFLP